MSELYPETLRLALHEERAASAAASSPENLARVHERIAYRVARGIAPSVSPPRWTPVVVAGLAGVAVGIVVGAAFWFERPDIAPSITTPVATAPPARSPKPTAPSVRVQDAGRAPVVPAESASAHVEQTAPATTTSKPRAAPASPPRTATKAARAEAKPVAESIAAQLRLFERAEAAAAEGRYDTAEKAYRQYITAFPDGTLIVEARLGTAALRLKANDAPGAERVLAPIDIATLGPGLRRQVKAMRAEAK